MKKLSQKSDLQKIVLWAGTILSLLFPHIGSARYIIRPQDQAVFHNNQGVNFLNEGNPQKALFEFKMAVEISPESAEGWNNLGLTYLYLNQYGEAERALKQAIQVDKKYPTPYNHLATLYYNQGNYTEALKWSEEAIQRDKKFADAYYNQGLIYQQLAQKGEATNYAKAEQAFRNATESNNRHYLANFELANIYTEQGKTEAAIMRYKVALEIQPSAAQAWERLGNLYLKQGRNQEAQFALNKAIEANPNLSGAHLSLGLLYLQEKNFPLADKEIAAASQKDPNNPRVLFNLAFAKLSRAEEIRGRQGMNAALPVYQESIMVYKRLLEKFPQYADGAYNLGYIYGRLGDLPQALSWYGKAVNMDSNHYKALFSLGMLEVETGKKKEGVEHLCRFLKIVPATNTESSRTVAEKIIAENGRCK